MSQRDDLIVAAKKCLKEQGYARTTARDLATASGANLSSIGYHFGSKDELLVLALVELMGDWGQAISKAVQDMPNASPVDHFAARWAVLIEILRADGGIAAANFEVFAQLARSASLRKTVKDIYAESRLRLVDSFLPEAVGLPEATRWAIGSTILAMMPGIMSQILVDPDGAPSADDLVDAFLGIGRSLAAEGQIARIDTSADIDRS